ncbi:LysR family transcriptional regulator [Micromonospora sp. NBC_01796]|uniref:LysR family transcriptional regulator n=1 Tax=Micromonospora sp. NBC_01796 TaxID=2975987 RepID=UPI002DD7E12B|nr:LysR substrate-binding domain-containing protein [Micromonospora sp. NBC_01796]WSA84363.1 LysR substrate-binding domain-containing protein [Micromonospora sp. NBC_01796]
MDIDLRKLRYFVAVAELLHFGRAAQRLHIAQPVLSRQIRALEQELRVQLFVRDRRSTVLTEAGRQLLADAVPLLASAEALHRRVRRAAHDRPAFTIGFMPGITVTAEARAIAARHPDLTVDVVRTSWHDQVEAVHDGRVDVSYVRLPVNQRGLRLRPLFGEPRVAVLPTDHRLAGKESVVLAELATERLVQDPDAVPEWRDLPNRPTEEEPRARPDLSSVEEKLEHVATYGGVVILPYSTATFYTRGDVTHTPVEDLPDTQVCLAWSDGNRSPLVAEFVELATAHHRSTDSGSVTEPQAEANGSSSRPDQPPSTEPGSPPSTRSNSVA